VSSSRTADNTVSSSWSVAKVSSLTTNRHRRRHYFDIYVSENVRYISITWVLHSEKVVGLATRLSVVNFRILHQRLCQSAVPIRGSRLAENRWGLLWIFRRAIGITGRQTIRHVSHWYEAGVYESCLEIETWPATLQESRSASRWYSSMMVDPGEMKLQFVPCIFDG